MAKKIESETIEVSGTGSGGRFPAQVVFTTTHEQRQAVQGMADEFYGRLGTSRAEVIRLAIEYGLPRAERELTRKAKRP